MTASRNLHKKRRQFDECFDGQDCGYVTPCFIWNGNIADTGYGRFGEGGRMWLAHRYAYERHFGKIPEGLSVDHLCRIRSCVNPEHLEAIDLAENTRREHAALVASGEWSKRLGPQCGHEQDPHWTNCRICATRRREAYKAKLLATFGRKTVIGGFGRAKGAKLDEQRRLRGEKAAQIAELYLAGVPTPKIAARFGLSDKASVHHYLKVAGVSANRAPTHNARGAPDMRFERGFDGLQGGSNSRPAGSLSLHGSGDTRG